MSPEIPTQREAALNLLESLTERHWDLLDELAQVELGRTACLLALREASHE